jgi:hypothetical protein
VQGSETRPWVTTERLAVCSRQVSNLGGRAVDVAGCDEDLGAGVDGWLRSPDCAVRPKVWVCRVKREHADVPEGGECVGALRKGGGDHVADEGAAFIVGNHGGGLFFLAGGANKDGVIVNSWGRDKD